MLDLPVDTTFLLAALPPSPRQRRMALAIVVLAILGAAAIKPFGAIELGFYVLPLAVMQTLVTATDLIIAVLLYSQYAILGWRSLLWLAGCYLFSALIGVVHYLSYPGVLSPTGILGHETTGWLFIAWHSALPIAAIAYALRKGADFKDGRPYQPSHAAIALNASTMVALCCGIVGLAMLANDRLPPYFRDAVHLTYLAVAIDTALALLFIVALAILWMRRLSVLDLWLMAILAVWLISLVQVFLNAGGARFTVAFYLARAYWLITVLFILFLLLSESTVVYARLANAVVLSRRGRASQAVMADAMSASFAHELSQPVAAMVAHGEAALLWLNKAPTDFDKVRLSLEQVAGDGRRASDAIKSVRAIFQDNAARKVRIDVNPVIREALAIERKRRHDFPVQVDLKLANGLPQVLADRSQLLHVALSLIDNAIDLMPAAKAQPRVLTVQTRVSASGRLAIAFLSSGSLAAAERAPAEFAAFAATRGQDAGLGLWLCRRIIELHDGTLTAEPGAVSGSVFTMFLPALPAT